MLAYAIIVATALTGLVGLPWWTIVLGAIGLTLVSMSEHVTYRSRSSRVATADVLSATSFASLANGGLAAGAAFVLGKVTAVMWGI